MSVVWCVTKRQKEKDALFQSAVCTSFYLWFLVVEQHVFFHETNRNKAATAGVSNKTVFRPNSYFCSAKRKVSNPLWTAKSSFHIPITDQHLDSCRNSSVCHSEPSFCQSQPTCMFRIPVSSHQVDRSGDHPATGAQTLLCHMSCGLGFKWLISQTGFPRL